MGNSLGKPQDSVAGMRVMELRIPGEAAAAAIDAASDGTDAAPASSSRSMCGSSRSVSSFSTSSFCTDGASNRSLCGSVGPRDVTDEDCGFGAPRCPPGCPRCADAAMRKEMETGPAADDGNWRGHLGCLQRYAHILMNSMWTDVTFSVQHGTGPAELIQCHKLMLATASPVFEAMLYGPLAEGGVVEIKDISPQIFRMMLLFIYSGSFPGTSFEMAISLCMAADKYLLYDLKMRCLQHMHSKLTPVNAVYAYEFAGQLDCTHLRNEAMQVMIHRTEEVIEHGGILEAHVTTMMDLLNQEELKLKNEKVLWDTVLRWGKYECLRKGAQPGGDALRRVLRPLLAAVRFLTMKPQEFAEGPAASEVLSDDECKAVLLHLATRRAPVALPEDLCASRRRRCYTCVFFDVWERDKPSAGSLSVAFGVRRPLEAVGLLVATRWFSGATREVSVHVQRHNGCFEDEDFFSCVAPVTPCLAAAGAGAHIVKFPYIVPLHDEWKYRIVLRETATGAVYAPDDPDPTTGKKPHFMARRYDLINTEFFLAILCI